jgi:putative ABC transport system permease protein
LSALTRRFFPRRARFVVRQGIASLFRPHNQTAAVTVSLGFGVFLIATLWTVQRNLLDWIRVEASDSAPNLVAFDIQSDQRADIASLFEANGVPSPEFTPIVTARIAAINGRESRDILEDSLARREIEGWTLRREYRNTYRSNLTDTEELVAGEWFDGTPAPPASGQTEEEPRGRGRRRRSSRAENAPAPVRTPPPADASSLPRVSMEREVAAGLGVGVGDVITWDVQGVRVETRIASLRTVDWARFETNFFVVFEPGILEDAPQNFVALVRVPDATARARVQRDVVRAHTNVSIIDIALVQETLTRIVDKAALAIRFMALFSVIGGGIVLLGAIAASRFQRMRESVLLRALGATRRQVVQVLFTEYAALGAMAGLVGVTLGGIASWALITQVFEIDFTAPLATLVGLWAIVAALAVAIGLVNSREVLNRTPLAVLRDATE